MFASLFVLPALIFAAGGEWTRYDSFDPADVALSSVETAEPGALVFSLAFVEEGSELRRGARLKRGDRVTIRLERGVRDFAVTLQGAARHSFRISVSADGDAYEPFWVAPAVRRMKSLRGLRSRTSPLLEMPDPIRFIRIEPMEGPGSYVLSGIRVHERVWRTHYGIIAVALWGAWIALSALTRIRSTRAAAWRVLGFWKYADAGIAALLIGFIWFDFSDRPVASASAVVLIACALFALDRALRRVAADTVLAAVFSIAVAMAVVPKFAAQRLLDRVAETHELSVDHRNNPERDGINSDGLRSELEASDLRDEDFVVLFLGDSFTFGVWQQPEDTYPAQVEEILRARGCDRRLHAVNFGWTSSSPLLSLRALRELGARYRPDLVVYNLDLSDFHDDLAYAAKLREGGDHGYGTSEVLWAALVARVPVVEFLRDRVADLLPIRSRSAVPGRSVEAEFPQDRYFITSRPLDASREWIERGVMRNLALIDDYSKRVLDSELVVFLLPRAYQYSRRENPRNWAAGRYEVLGPYVREPSRWVEEVKGRVPFRLFDLMPAFENSERFPLFHESDPHWSDAGARVMAEAVAAHLIDEALVPCPAAGGG